MAFQGKVRGHDFHPEIWKEVWILGHELQKSTLVWPLDTQTDYIPKARLLVDLVNSSDIVQDLQL
jgi:hypothetical protein